jgi:DNA-binding transcriptional regulator YiaG
MGQRVPQKDKDAFAAKLKAWRRRENLSQSEAAEFLNLSIRTLQNWEIARTKPPGIAHRLLLAFISPVKRPRSGRNARR